MLELKKNGQIYRFLDRYADVHGINNLCELWSVLVGRVILLVFLGFVAVFTLWSVVHFVLLVSPFGLPLPLPVPMAVAMTLFLIVVGLLLVLFIIYIVLESGSHLKNKIFHSTLFTETYRGWKEKYCPRVRWVDKNNE